MLGLSTTGSIEGINAIRTGKLISPFSEQQLVSCDTAKDLGCGGGAGCPGRLSVHTLSRGHSRKGL